MDRPIPEHTRLMLCKSLGAPTNMDQRQAMVWIGQNLPPESLVQSWHLKISDEMANGSGA